MESVDAKASEFIRLEDEYACLTFHDLPQLEEERDINCYRYRFFSDYLAPALGGGGGALPRNPPRSASAGSPRRH